MVQGYWGEEAEMCIMGERHYMFKVRERERERERERKHESTHFSLPSMDKQTQTRR